MVFWRVTYTQSVYSVQRLSREVIAGIGQVHGLLEGHIHTISIQCTAFVKRGNSWHRASSWSFRTDQCGSGFVYMFRITAGKTLCVCMCVCMCVCVCRCVFVCVCVCVCVCLYKITSCKSSLGVCVCKITRCKSSLCVCVYVYVCVCVCICVCVCVCV